MTFNRVPGTGVRPARPCRCDCGCATRARRYPSDLTDAQWAVLEPAAARDAVRHRAGRPPGNSLAADDDRRHVLRRLDSGCKWRALPGDFPPWKTVYSHVRPVGGRRGLGRVVDLLRARVRPAEGRDPEPSAGGHRRPVGRTSRPRASSRPRPAASTGTKRSTAASGTSWTDTLGLLIVVVVIPREHARTAPGPSLLLMAARAAGRARLAHVWADKGYIGELPPLVAPRTRHRPSRSSHQPPAQHGFHVLPRRWVVERTNAWITRRRRCARDYERLPEHHAGMVLHRRHLPDDPPPRRSPAMITPAPARV